MFALYKILFRRRGKKMDFANNFHLIINFWTSIIHANNTFIDVMGKDIG